MDRRDEDVRAEIERLRAKAEAMTDQIDDFFSDGLDPRGFAQATARRDEIYAEANRLQATLQETPDAER